MQTLVEYQNVMIEGGSSMKEYIRAVKFCAYLEGNGGSLIEAYKMSRQEDKFVQDRWDAKTDSVEYKELSFQASRYRKTRLVKQLLTQTEMPLYLMFQAERYKAVAVLAREMHTAQQSRDRINAAKELLANVKPPDNVQVELAVGPTQEAIDLSTQLSEQLAASVAMQRKMLEAGVDIKDATKLGVRLNDSDIVDAEVSDA